MKLTSVIILAVASPIAATGRPSFRPFGVSVPNRSQFTCINNGVLDIRGGAVHESSTLSDLESKIQGAALQDKLTVVDFTATWCGPCKMIAPLFKEMSEEMGSRAQFIKVDVDDNPEAAQKYGVSAMPTFLFIKGGEVVDRLMGANSERLKETGGFGVMKIAFEHVNNEFITSNIAHKAQLRRKRKPTITYKDALMDTETSIRGTGLDYSRIS
ncbi:hypothetical protein ACHAXR_005387 [Thalassiosira sp. AJA248-18]